jgi:peptide/histidine transporter 3/4
MQAFAFIPTNFAFIASLLIGEDDRAHTSYYLGAFSDIVSYSFFPLAGFLADVRYGRYKTILSSLYLVLVSMAIFLLIVGPLAAVVFATSGLIASVLLYISGSIFILLFYTGFVGFLANVIPFGMDQLYDSPGDDRTLFIHWYMWTAEACTIPIRLVLSFTYKFPKSETFGVYYELTGCYLQALAAAGVLAATMCLAHYQWRHIWIEQGRFNPYKLVYKVTKFAGQHKTPVCRSALTYCEDEVPRGLDLGKEKYGGPFTIEQVEDVKAFYGVLKVILSAWLVQMATYPVLPITFSSALTVACNNATSANVVTEILNGHGLLWCLLFTVCIPIYLYLLRPFFSRVIPGMLERVGLGIIAKVLTVFIQTLHYFMIDYCLGSSSFISALSFTKLWLLVLSDMLMFIGGYEFICSQSPQSMKGLIIGLFYAAQGFYRLMAILLGLPFLEVSPASLHYYYLMNSVISIASLMAYVWVSKRYRYRVRDEQCNVHQYAEEYYSNPEGGRHHDYSYSEQN